MDPLIRSFSAFVHDTAGIPPDLQYKLLASLFIALGAWVAQRLLHRVAAAQFQNEKGRILATRLSGYALSALALLLIGRLWVSGLGGLSTFLGFVSAGLAIALRDIFINLAGWLYIMGRRPFQLGERIQLGEFRGDVIDIQLFQFSLMEIGNWVDADQPTGRVIHLPNSRVFQTPVANYDQGQAAVFQELAFTVTFDSAWDRAKALALRLAERETERRAERKTDDAPSRKDWLFPEGPAGPSVYTRLTEHGIRVTVRYLVNPRRRRESEDRYWDALLRALADEPSVRLAYPTQTFELIRSPVRPPSATPGGDGSRAPGP